MCNLNIIEIGERNMSVLQGILLDEINRQERNIAGYKNLLKSLPRGTIFIRKIGNQSFAYRKRKENGKVVSEYLGNIESQKAKDEILRSEDYKNIKHELAIATRELERLRKAYNTYVRKRRGTEDDSPYFK